MITLRQVSATGRSRAVVGGAGVPVAALADLISDAATGMTGNTIYVDAGYHIMG